VIFKKSVFGDIIFDEEYTRIKQTPDRISDDDDFDDGKIYKISNVLNISCVVVTCDALKTFLSNYNEEANLKRNQDRLNSIYRIFNNGVRNVKIQLIENLPCDGVYN
jgi:hypothetical protein